MSATSDSLRYLADHADWLAHQQDADQVFDELEHVSALVDTMIDSRPALIYAGPCDVCRRDMYAREGEATVVCLLCNLPYAMEVRRTHLLDQVADQLDTAANIAAAVTDLGEPVTPDAIRKWAERGRLIAKGKNHRGHPTYRVGDVLDLRRTMRKKAG